MSPVEHDRMRAVEDYWLYRALRKEVARMMHPPRRGFSVLDAGWGSGGMLASRGSHDVAVKVDRRYTAYSSLACFARPALALADLLIGT